MWDYSQSGLQRQIYLQVLARSARRWEPCNFPRWVSQRCSALCRLIRELISASHPGSRVSRLSGTHSVPWSRGPASGVGPPMGSCYCLVITSFSNHSSSLKLDKINMEVYVFSMTNEAQKLLPHEDINVQWRWHVTAHFLKITGQE